MGRAQAGLHGLVVRRLALLVSIALVAMSCSSDEVTPITGEAGLTALGPLEAEVGSVPRFEWSAIDGAATYRLAVLGPSGPIWAWEGEETAVNLGGLTGDRPEAMPGPVVEAGTSWSVAALDTSGRIIDLVGPIEISPGDTTATEPPETDTTVDEISAADLPDPCLLVPQDFVQGIWGENGPEGEPGETPGPGGIVGGRSCRWSNGIPVLRVAVFISPDYLMPLDICGYCEAVDGLGDDAWAGESDQGMGGSLVAIIVDGLGIQLSADGLDVSKDQLLSLAAAVIERMP